MKNSEHICEHCEAVRSLANQACMTTDQIKQIAMITTGPTGKRLSAQDLKWFVNDLNAVRETHQALELALAGFMDTFIEDDMPAFILNNKGQAALPALLDRKNPAVN